MTDPITIIKQVFPWIHPLEWTYPAPNHSQAPLDALQTNLNIISTPTHTLLFIQYPNTCQGPYDDESITITNASIPLIPGTSLYLDSTLDPTLLAAQALKDAYFKYTANLADENSKPQFQLLVTAYPFTYKILSPLGAEKLIHLNPGTPICLNPNKTTIGVPLGKALIYHPDKKIVHICHPHTWTYPNARPLGFYIEYHLKHGAFAPLPPEAGLPLYSPTPPNLMS